jgi:hypothetical protein
MFLNGKILMSLKRQIGQMWPHNLIYNNRKKDGIINAQR